MIEAWRRKEWNPIIFTCRGTCKSYFCIVVWLPDGGGSAGGKVERFHEHEPNQAGVVAVQVSGPVCPLLELARAVVEVVPRMEVLVKLFLGPERKRKRQEKSHAFLECSQAKRYINNENNHIFFLNNFVNFFFFNSH